MPGDHLYDPSSFQIVIVWNGVNHYIPSYLVHHSSILEYKCSLITQLLGSATELFGQIESDLDESGDEVLIEKFHSLRDNTVQSKHLLNIRGLESTHFPPSTCGPDSRDTVSHLTRKTPLPKDPQPLIKYALQHSLDPDSALRKEHPTPLVPFPPRKEDIKSEDFEIDPDEYQDETVRCIKIAGQLAPQRLLPSKKEILVSIPLPNPLPPELGHPPAKSDSKGARRFRKGANKPLTEPEVVQQVLDLPQRGRIAHKIDKNSGKQPVAAKASKDDSEQITQKTAPIQPEVVASQEPVQLQSQSEDVAAEETVRSQPEVVVSQEPVQSQSQSEDVAAEEITSRIMRQSSRHLCECPIVLPDDEEDEGEDNPLVIDIDDDDDDEPRITRVEGLISETVEDITLEEDPEEETEKIKSLKRKHLGTRKSPRVKVQKMDLSEGVSSALPRQERSALDFLTKSIVKNIKISQPVTGTRRRDQSSVSSSSQSSSGQQKSAQQRSVLQMFAQAAFEIKEKSGKKTQPVVQCAQPQQSQRPVHPPAQWITQVPPAQRIMQRPVAVPCQITQADPEKGTILRCTYCAYTTLRKESLNDHLRMHTGEKIKCSDCEKTYYSKKSFRNHFRIIHMQKDRCLCTETGCTWSGKDYGNRKVHLYEEHGIGDPPVCEHPDCRERGHFSNFRTLERHRETFHNAKGLMCPHKNCGKKYKEAENLSNHIAVHHQGQSAYQCEICGQFYVSRKSLEGHKKEHE